MFAKCVHVVSGAHGVLGVLCQWTGLNPNR